MCRYLVRLAMLVMPYSHPVRLCLRRAGVERIEWTWSGYTS